MVLYFKARPDAGDYTIYMGADKNENEELIKYGLPEDVWYVRTSSLAAATSYFLATTTTTTCRMRFSGELNHGEVIRWWVGFRSTATCARLGLPLHVEAA